MTDPKAGSFDWTYENDTVDTAVIRIPGRGECRYSCPVTLDDMHIKSPDGTLEAVLEYECGFRNWNVRPTDGWYHHKIVTTISRPWHDPRDPWAMEKECISVAAQLISIAEAYNAA